MLLVYVVCVCVQVNTKNLLKLCMEGQSVCIHVCGMDAHYTQIKLNVVHTLTVSADYSLSQELHSSV